MSAEQVAQVALYMKARLANDVATVLTLVADDISFSSPKESHQGKADFEKFLNANKASGNFSDPVAEGDHVVVHGTVKVMMASAKLATHFHFNGEGKINKVEIVRE